MIAAEALVSSVGVSILTVSVGERSVTYMDAIKKELKRRRCEARDGGTTLRSSAQNHSRSNQLSCDVYGNL